ncbi:PDZ domain-containing protein [bacterium]|nr:PDZ domain-containing protein [bacterium]
MRIRHALPLLLLLTACEPRKSAPPAPAAAAETVAPPVKVAKADIKSSVVRINSTQQSWNPGQPWEKNPPNQRRALAAIVGPQRVLTTSELVADATYLEFESPDGTRFAQAKVLAVDYEANLALLGPVSETEGKLLFEGTTPLELTAPPKIGQMLEMLQIEENGLALLTPGSLQSIDVTSNFLPGHGFLTYLIKASMQSAASSYSLPVLQGGKLAGVLISYNAKDQICEVASTDIVARFLAVSSNGEYKGFPSLGISITRTEDASFRQWLKLPDDQGGIYVQNVRKGRAADLAGVKKGDVLLAIDGKAIDRRGYYQHPNYGSLFWGHLIRGEKATGDTVTLSLLRDGQPLEIKAILTREEESTRLVPGYNFGKAPNFLIKGGLVFQELSRPLLESFGENWQTRAPLEFLDALENPEKYEDQMDRIVFLSGSIPTPATVGYESLRNLIVRKVNGKEIKNMKSLIEAFRGNLGERHSIEFAEQDFTVYLDEVVSSEVDSQLLKRGISRLSRAE